MSAQPRQPLWSRVTTRGVLQILAATVVLIALPGVVPSDWVTTLSFIAIAVVGAVSLQMLTGFAGLVSLGHAAFFAVGAYTVAAMQPGRNPWIDRLLGDLPAPLSWLAGNAHGWPLILGLVVCGVLNGLLGALVSLTAIRLRGIYLAIVTLGLVFAIQYLFTNWDAASGGGQGMTFAPPSVGPFSFGGETVIGDLVYSSTRKLFYLTAFAALTTVIALANLRRSRKGRQLIAMRDRELAAVVFGISVRANKVAAFAASSAMAGIAGGLYGTLLGFAVPGTWDLTFSVKYVAMIIIGGMGTVSGAVLGAIFVEGLPALLRAQFSTDIRLLGFSMFQLQQLVFGIAVVLILAFAPAGLAGAARLLPRLQAVGPWGRNGGSPSTPAVPWSDTWGTPRQGVDSSGRT